MRESAINKPCLYMYTTTSTDLVQVCIVENATTSFSCPTSHKPQTAANVQQLPLNVLKAIKLKLSHNHSLFG